MVKCFFTAIFSSCIVAYIFKIFFSVPNGGNVISNKRILAGYYLPSLPPLKGFLHDVDAQKTPEPLFFREGQLPRQTIYKD